MARISEATSITLEPAWIKPDDMVLHAERLKLCGETPKSAMGPVDWKWDSEGPLQNSVTDHHKSAMQLS